MRRVQLRPMGRPTTIFGQAYASINDKELGIGSYHFVDKSEAYISYENEQCTDVFPRLDNRDVPGVPGDRIPRRMYFRNASWDPQSRTFRGTVSFSRDMGDYEEVHTVDGVEKEEYELVFSDDFETIVNGCCRSWYPNASKSHRCEQFGVDLLYRRWQYEGPADQIDRSRSSWQDCKAGEGRQATEVRRPFDVNLVTALFTLDVRKMSNALEAGVSVECEVDSVELWKKMRWDPGKHWESAAPRTPVLVATIMFQWAAGVELCVRHGADVNRIYYGPFRLASGGIGGCPMAGVPILRVALSARSQSQCLICRYVLDGGVNGKVFRSVKQKAQDEMEFDTKDLFGRWSGPFSRSKA